MRLTVGPLPAAVYWRRRGVVLVGLAMIVLIILYAFSGPDGSANTNAAPTPSDSGSTPSPTATAPPPTTASPSASAFTLPVSGATGPCTDAEMEVTAAAAVAEVKRGTPVEQVDFTLKIKNISSRTCVRDIGADMQELQLRDGVTVVWSSDDCLANHSHFDQQFTPGFEMSFTRTWAGYRSRGGNNTVDCTLTLEPDAKVYELVARLDQKFSAPFMFTISLS